MYPIQPIKVNFGKEGMEGLSTYMWENLQVLIQSNADLHNNKVKKWRRLYKGIPKDEHRSFPWDNASNVVVQVIGTAVDTLKAKVLTSIYEVMPLYITQTLGEWESDQQAEEQRTAIEAAMAYFGTEPSELDLYRVENLYFDEAIKFGTAFAKVFPVRETENQVISLDGTRSEREWVKYEGPKVEKIPFDKFLISPTASSLDSANFKAHVITLRKFDLLDRKQRGIYNKDEMAKIMEQPDRTGPSPAEMERLKTEGITISQNEHTQEWDIYECYFPYWHNGSKYRLICSFHYKTRTLLKSVFNFLPNNIDPFKMARLGYNDDGIYGYGYCEMLDHYQEEASTIHNQRGDNRTLANTAVMRASRASKLDSIFSLYPGAVIPGEKDELEMLPLGTPYPSSVQEETMVLSLADKRAGSDSGFNAPGGGIQNPRKGIYSAQGTFAVLQSGNKISNIRITDMKYAHIELGRLILQMYAHFGLGGKEKLFGKQGATLIKALESVKEGKLVFPIRAATGSINRELEKQNDMMLVNILHQHHQGIAQILMTLNGPQALAVPPTVQKYLSDTIEASNQLMKHILRNFNHEDTSRLLPEVQKQKGAPNGQQGQQATGVNPPTEESTTQAAGSASSGASTIPEASGQERTNTIPI